MDSTEILLTISNILNNFNINYMIVGADAVNFYGRPRTSHDIDIKVAILLKDVCKKAVILRLCPVTACSFGVRNDRQEFSDTLKVIRGVNPERYGF